ncbi:MAG TPA: helix-turn-helix domain-containing protein [Gordonia sp. (in: high G+C Gram-positive bacteria)]|uniref:winged helix-turn-helix transcriptional regulator n=1 Tax=unclassified Gordonia (in: high G+C Gram-positive bacteria) TaxID=2657482 RepID=UPI000F9F1BE3|nr:MULTISPECIES: helix-turn-helix domain-containing protein [unclassified Gordonia (in: high G+C Gram-positive bacteria)]RUP40388.1 MAG: transcriptional regulator [Gordonia sp. (in: high G+C Gram-positive bacteria)]HNP57093.1 helix-turn-helix domain-containing protein [Gordonia sp. (in: high G+C Gram-positive bacteria)]HRC49370.1 helix-turn-helix domain-containing protein [Gordonia sp. (in: high G+C Gram-positive bacteria)]
MKEYGQFCGLARSLDVVGDRWSLLIVRQLLVGPARYGQLQAGLPGIATNLLANRLRDLEASGVLEKRVGSGGVEYALTEWGAGLREPIEALVRWSTPLMIPGPGDDEFQVDWLVVALPALLAGRRTPTRSATVGLRIDDETVLVSATRKGFEVLKPDGRDVDGVVVGEAHPLLGLAAGLLTVDDGPFVVEGDADAVRAVFA